MWPHLSFLTTPFARPFHICNYLFCISFLPHLCLYSSNGREERGVSLTPFSITANLIILQCSTQVQPSPSSLSGFLQAEFIPSFLHVSSGLCYVEDYACHNGWPVIVNPGNCQCNFVITARICHSIQLNISLLEEGTLGNLSYIYMIETHAISPVLYFLRLQETDSLKHFSQYFPRGTSSKNLSIYFYQR